MKREVFFIRRYIWTHEIYDFKTTIFKIEKTMFKNILTKNELYNGMLEYNISKKQFLVLILKKAYKQVPTIVLKKLFTNIS